MGLGGSGSRQTIEVGRDMEHFSKTKYLDSKGKRVKVNGNMNGNESPSKIGKVSL